MRNSKQYPVILPSGKIIGFVYREKWDDKYRWNSECYLSDVGHGGIETKEEAEKDVLDMHKENLSYRKKLLMENIYFQTATESEILNFKVGKVSVKIEISCGDNACE